MANSVKDVDKGYQKLVSRVFNAALARFGTLPLRVGIFEDIGAKGYADNEAVTTLMVAQWQEFGTLDGRVPERSFIRAYVDENESRIREMQRRMLESVISGKRTEAAALELLGLKLVGEIQARISAGIAPPNAEATVKRKGSATPLIDTGQLRGSITHRVGDPRA